MEGMLFPVQHIVHRMEMSGPLRDCTSGSQVSGWTGGPRDLEVSGTFRVSHSVTSGVSPPPPPLSLPARTGQRGGLRGESTKREIST